MATVSQDEFMCPVCLELLKDPVTVSCGHSFCKVCINGCWDQEDQRGAYNCPECRETFTSRPVLRRNNMLAEVVEKLKKTEVQAASAADCYAGAADVECDFCTETKLKAVKSCLVCLASYCETHIKPHYQSPAFKKHQLVEASTNLQEKICSQHEEVIKIYCRTDQRFICSLCLLYEHKGHDTVAAVAERKKKQSELKELQTGCEQRLQEKQKTLEEVKQAVNTIKRSAQAAVEESERIFTEMIDQLEKKCSEAKKLIRDQEKVELSRAEGVLEQLEQEMADLKRRDAELQQLSHTEDHIHFLQSFQSLCVSSGSQHSSSISVHQRPSFDGVIRSLSALKERLEQFCREEFNKLPAHAAAAQIISPEQSTCRADFLPTLYTFKKMKKATLSSKYQKLTAAKQTGCIVFDDKTKQELGDFFQGNPNELWLRGKAASWANQSYMKYMKQDYLGLNRKPLKGEKTNGKENEGGNEEDDKCPICLDTFTEKQKLKCGHEFCKDCLAGSVKSLGKSCPVCKDVFGTLIGNQPDGKMTWHSQRYSLSGLPNYGTIEIDYFIPSGNQTEAHPNPGQRFSGTQRHAYLPDNKEGREVLKLLKRAFDQKLIFTVGTSTTTGQNNAVTWNDIHHKTRPDGGPENYGYPDADYLKRVKDELKAKGIE